ncbi:hypothetical protein FACS1894110_26370 [Spirochaetia bacterium]|nr:hypothetical protein FACS1894110_26370 [Spirochaetia bacterium]
MASEYKYTCPKCGHIWMSTKLVVNNKCPNCGTAAKREEIKK